MDRPGLKYSARLVKSGLCEAGAPLFGIMEDGITWSGRIQEEHILEEVLNTLNFGSILFSPTAEPFRSITELLAGEAQPSGSIVPDDTETRTFLHEIPVISAFTPGEIITALKRRKGAIIPGRGIITAGPVTPEQAFVTFSSICFSCYVKFFSDYYYYTRGVKKLPDSAEKIAPQALKAYRSALKNISDFPSAKGPFTSDEAVYAAIVEAGRLTVSSGMVDSFFGNVSALFNDCIYITQTAASLDELEGCIDCCPLDNSSTCAITSSSEYSAHRALYNLTHRRTVLHGHPRFSVIMSLLCDRHECANRGRCHTACTAKRFINDIPVVPGEIGTGPLGLVRTMPAAMMGRGVIVHGHGLFTAGACDFMDAFTSLVDIERMCFEEYCRLVQF